MAYSTSRLFNGLTCGRCRLQHRIVMSPLTRFRADESSVPLAFVKDYYSQRASVPGTLIISEATAICKEAVGFSNVPGIWTAEQIRAWKEIADCVHAKGSFIFLQLWATGRAVSHDEPYSDSYRFVSSSPIPILEGDPIPDELSDDEINLFVAHFATAAKNAVIAGMDGVEIHGANGYLVDQFTQSSCNKRTDKWGGSLQARARFALEVTKAVAGVVGPDRVGIKLSPWGKIQGMGSMPDLKSQFQYLISELRDMSLAYLHMANSRWLDEVPTELESNDNFIRSWGKSSLVILEGGYDAQSAREDVDERYKDFHIAIAFGRLFISNPDLPFRIKMDIKLQDYDRDSFYTPMSMRGYVDYPFSAQFEASSRDLSTSAEMTEAESQ